MKSIFVLFVSLLSLFKTVLASADTIDPRVHWTKGTSWVVKTNYRELATTHSEIGSSREIYWLYRVADDKMVKYDYTTRKLYLVYFIMAEPQEELNLRHSTASPNDDPFGLQFARLFLFIRNDEATEGELSRLAADGALSYNDDEGRKTLTPEQVPQLLQNNREARDAKEQVILVGFRYQRRDSTNQYSKLKPPAGLPISTNYSIIPYDMPLFPVTSEISGKVRVSFKNTLDHTPVAQAWGQNRPWFSESSRYGSRSVTVAVGDAEIAALVKIARIERTGRLLPRTIEDLQRQVMDRRLNEPGLDSGEKLDRVRIPEPRGREIQDDFRNLRPQGR